MRLAFAFALAAALMIRPAAGQEREPSGAPARYLGCPTHATPDRLTGLTPQGDLVLASGGLAKLSEIRLPDPPSAREAALAWLLARMGQPVLVRGGGSRDRWDRALVQVSLADPSGPALDLGHGLIEAGLALVDPGAAEVFCQPALLALEQTARGRKLGLWEDARYNPIEVEQTSRLRERIGSFALVEGRVRSVGEREQRIFLNFGGTWAEDFTIVIPRKTWALMAKRGLDARALKGRRIRARGILQSWQGPALTIVIPDMIERLEGRH